MFFLNNYFFKKRSSFTLVELLIVIGILAILTVAVVIVLNPAEYLKQSRDSKRITDLASVDKILSVLETQSPSMFFGTSSVIYISVPDSSSTCGNLGLSAVSGYTYNCAPTTTYTRTDGTGWVPVNFNSEGVAQISALPIDPINETSTKEFYSYVPGGSWKFITKLMSDKYKSRAINDGGNDDAVYEAGSDKSVIFGGPMYGINHLKGSEDFVTGWGPIWYLDADSITSNSTTSPSGSSNADRVDGNFSRCMAQYPDSTYQNGDYFTVSAWMKSDTPGMGVMIHAHIGGDWGVAKVVYLTSDWVKYSNTFRMTATAKPTILFCYGSTYVGGSNLPFYIWGAQLSPSASSSPYVRTTTSIVQ